MNDFDEMERMMTEEYFDKSGCGCIAVFTIVAIVALVVAFIILCAR